MLGSGGSLVADAVSEGQIPNFKNSNWEFSDSIAVSSAGTYIFPKNTAGTAYYTLNLVPGEKYKISGNYTIAGNAASPSGMLALEFSGGGEIILVDSKSKGTFPIDREFVAPSPDGKVVLSVLLGAWTTLEYSSTWKIENTSTDKGILNSIKEGFSKLWDWLKSILDNIKEIPTKIAASLTALGDRIRDFFTSLGDRISGFFDDIWEKIKSFFLPSDGFFDEYSAKFNAFIDEHFGFLAQLPDKFSLIINMLVNYTPADPPYIDFPTIRVPVPGHEFTLVEGQRYTFTILTQSPYNTLYTAYQGFVWLAYCLMLFNFLKHKYNVIFGGDGSAD